MFSPFGQNASFRHKDFMVMEELGRGGMGIVYKCTDKALVEVAVKIIGWNYSNSDIVRFHKEASTLAKLSHPNIVAVRDFGHSEDDSLFLVMELLKGKSLDQGIQGGPAQIVFDDALQIFIQICDGLAHAHGKGILHRDIKPSNIFIEPTSTGQVIVKITDFGLAKLSNEDQRLTKTGATVGSPPYMSPEQAGGKPVDERSDIYSLGCLMFEVLIGETPYVAVSIPEMLMQHINAPVPYLRERDPERNFPEEIEAIIAKCMAKDPEQRYQKVTQLRAALVTLREEVLPAYGTWDNVKDYFFTGAFFRTGAYLKTGFQKFAKPTRPYKLIALTVVAVILMGLLIGTTIKGLANLTFFKDSLSVDFKMSKEEEKNGGDPFDPQDQLVKKNKTKKFDKIWIRIKGTGAHEKIKEIVETVRHIPFGQHPNWIDFGGSDVTDEQLKDIVGINFLGVRLNKTKITDEGLKAISQLKNLEELNLDDTNISDAGVAHLVNNKRLSMLSLKKTKVTDKAIELMSADPELNWLSVSQCPGVKGKTLQSLRKLPYFWMLSIGGTGFKNLSTLKGLKDLELVDLTDLDLTDNDLKDLANAKLRNLRTVIVDFNPRITDAGLLNLVEMKMLSQLNIYGIPGISEAGKKRFHELRPACVTRSSIAAAPAEDE